MLQIVVHDEHTVKDFKVNPSTSMYVVFFLQWVNSKASLGPYAWESSIPATSRRKRPHTMEEDLCPKRKHNLHTHTNMISTVGEAECLHDDVQCLPRSMEVFSMIDSDACLSQRLPPVGATAGKVLEHGARVFAKLQEQHSPMTFKFGITHNPHYRWNNTTFGYKWCVDKFQHMIILFAAGNPYAPAFLEASLIREFGSAMAFFFKDVGVKEINLIVVKLISGPKINYCNRLPMKLNSF